MLRPLNGFDIDSFLNHFPERREFTQTFHVPDSGREDGIDWLGVDNYSWGNYFSRRKPDTLLKLDNPRDPLLLLKIPP